MVSEDPNYHAQCIPLSHQSLKCNKIISVGFEVACSRFDHYPPTERVDLNVFRACEEYVDLRWILLNTGQWSGCDSSNHAMLSEHVIGRSKCYKCARY
jgi:hypothetical protein